MPVRDIRATIGVDGEKEFTDALNDAVRSMKLMDGEMKKVSAAYELSGDQTEYLAQKSQLLDSEMRQQERIIEALTGALSDAEKKYEGNTYKIDQYRTKLNAAETTMLKLRKASADTDKQMEELGRDSERTGRRLEQGIGEAADDVSRKFDSMVNKLDSDIGGIKSMTGMSLTLEVISTVYGAAKGAYDAVTGLVSETAEYNRTMSFLKINAEQAGISFESVKKMAIEVSGLTGDMDASIEGLSNLLASGFEADELATAVKRLSGAIIQIPDTLKFESLADGLQETIATRNAVGQYAEYLERMGLDLDTVNKALANAGKEGQEAVESAALAFLGGHGAEEAYEKYIAEYEELVKYFEAQSKLTDAQARLGETMTPVATAGIEMAAGFVDKMTDMIIEAGKVVETWKDAAEKGLLETSKDVEEARKNLSTEAWAPGITTDGSEANEAGKTDAGDYNDGVKEYFESTPIYIPSWDDMNPGIETGAAETGKNLVRSLGDAVEDNAYYAVAKVNAMMSRMQSALNRKITYPTISPSTTTSSAAYASAGTGKTTLSIDGKKLGEATVAYNNAALGQSLARAEIYG
ncbi:MAG: hypothetical protein ACI4MM_08755 [Candidatus Ventricola sp.]